MHCPRESGHPSWINSTWQPASFTNRNTRILCIALERVGILHGLILRGSLRHPTPSLGLSSQLNESSVRRTISTIWLQESCQGGLGTDMCRNNTYLPGAPQPSGASPACEILWTQGMLVPLQCRFQCRIRYSHNRCMFSQEQNVCHSLEWCHGQ